MNWLQTTLQTYPELAIFLALAAGFYIGNLKIGKFSLGVVTSVLLVGVIIGQLNIEISANVKSVFFLMFLFAVGYSVGPQFFSGLKNDGLPQIIFAVLQCVVSLVVSWLLAAAMGYNMGEAAGLIAGSQTISAVMGVATDTINQLDISHEAKASFINSMPVCYAVTYIFGTAGSAWILSSLGPMLLGGLEKVQEQCKELETKMGGGIGSPEPGMGSAINRVIFRAFLVKEGSVAVGKTVAEMEQYYLSIDKRLFIERMRKGDKVLDTIPSIRINAGDEIVLGGRRENMLDEEERIGLEVNDEALLDFEVKTVSVLVTKKEIAGMSLEDIKKSEFSHGVVLKRLLRAGIEMPILPKTTFEKGDIAEIVGFKKDVERAIAKTGYADVPTEKTDMVFVGIGIVLGGLFGALAIKIGGVPISLSTSGGALIAGLIFGWLRSKHPTFGRIPEPALWMMNNVGLNTFIAVVGITAGPSFVAGFKQVGPMLFLVGIAATSIPLLIGVLMGRFIFKFHPALTLGCAAGARTTTAALSAIQDAVKSKTPALGYTVTYAVGNTLLIIWGVVIVLLMK